MRITASNNNILPFYRDEKYLYNRQCPTCGPSIHVPRRGGVEDLVGVPPIELIYSESTFLSAVLVYNSCDDTLEAAFNLKRTVKEINGVEYVFFNTTSGPGLSEGSYYLQIIEIINGEPNTIVSEPYCVTDKLQCFKLSYWNDCDSSNAMADFKHHLYIDEIDFEKVRIEDTSEEKVNANGRVITTLLSSKKIQSFNLCSNGHLSETLSCIKGYDNIQLENLVTGEITILEEYLPTDSSQTECEFITTIEFVDSVKYYEKCCNELSPLVDPCITDPIDCEGYSVMINESNGTLTYTETGGNGSAQWLINGLPSGNGSSITLGAYGDYTIQLTVGGCTVSDVFTYNNPCDAVTLTVSANGPVISGSASGDNNIVVSICNSNGIQIGTGLPFTVPENQGDGYFTVKAIGDLGCEKQQTLFVTVEPPLNCEHSVSIDYTNGILTGSSTGCTSALDSEFIELEDENENITIVSNTNTFTPTVTGLYWYNAICNGCLKRIKKLVIISDCDDGPSGTCDDPLFFVQCDPPSSGTDTKVELPK